MNFDMDLCRKKTDDALHDKNLFNIKLECTVKFFRSSTKRKNRLKAIMSHSNSYIFFGERQQRTDPIEVLLKLTSNLQLE
jgi:hypothetical protein